jgi:hypothetical protein
MSKIISGSQTGSESRMHVISRADFQPGVCRDLAESSLATRGDLFPFKPGKYGLPAIGDGVATCL